MTDESVDADVIDDGQADVLAEDEVVHVPEGARELAEAHEHASTFLPEVEDWDGPPDELPEDSDGR
ncbi:hypothetical protein [Rugosimonospora africana]|uniref:hypothetical protein n=1 Tax=Rugosimonospora africana TaxID=556532 RepID=UPI0019409CDA|nr:hypothetical protein [Rugosimonospora africana]